MKKTILFLTINLCAFVSLKATDMQDSTFGTDGAASFADVNIYRTAVASSKKIYIVGSDIDGQMIIERLNENGSVDTSLVTTVTQPSGTGNDELKDVYPLTNGNFVVGGTQDVGDTSSANAFYLESFDQNGNHLDSITQNFGGDYEGSVLFSKFAKQIINNTTRIISVGQVDDAGTKRLAMTRHIISSNGTLSLDTTFGGGFIVDTTGVWNTVTCVAIQQPNNKILVSGTNFDNDWQLGRFNANGTPDTSFGGDGIQKLSNSGASTDPLKALILQSDGKILVAGGFGTSSSMGIARYAATPGTDEDGYAIPDSTFGSSGFTLVSGCSEGCALLITNQGNILVSGKDLDGLFAIVRLNSNGILDTSFGTNGILMIDFDSDTSGIARSMAPTGANAIVAGNSSNGGDYGRVIKLIPDSANNTPEEDQQNAYSDGVSDVVAIYTETEDGNTTDYTEVLETAAIAIVNANPASDVTETSAASAVQQAAKYEVASINPLLMPVTEDEYLASFI